MRKIKIAMLICLCATICSSCGGTKNSVRIEPSMLDTKISSNLEQVSLPPMSSSDSISPEVAYSSIPIASGSESSIGSSSEASSSQVIQPRRGGGWQDYTKPNPGDGSYIPLEAHFTEEELSALRKEVLADIEENGFYKQDLRAIAKEEPSLEEQMRYMIYESHRQDAFNALEMHLSNHLLSDEEYWRLDTFGMDENNVRAFRIITNRRWRVEEELERYGEVNFPILIEDVPYSRKEMLRFRREVEACEFINQHREKIALIAYNYTHLQIILQEDAGDFMPILKEWIALNDYEDCIEGLYYDDRLLPKLNPGIG